jgi:hypothetical protein
VTVSISCIKVKGKAKAMLMAATPAGPADSQPSTLNPMHSGWSYPVKLTLRALSHL